MMISNGIVTLVLNVGKNGIMKVHLIHGRYVMSECRCCGMKMAEPNKGWDFRCHGCWLKGVDDKHDDLCMCVGCLG